MLIEHVVRETDDKRGSILDLHMMVLLKLDYDSFIINLPFYQIMNKAKERTEKEFAILYEQYNCILKQISIHNFNIIIIITFGFLFFILLL